MIAMLELIFSLPMMELLALAKLMKSKPARNLTANDLIMRRRAIRTIELSLPTPNSEEEAVKLLRVLEHFDKEMDAITALERLNFIVAGTLPVTHDESIPPEKLS